MKENFNFLIYDTDNEKASVRAIAKDETIWLSQKSMAELFEKDTRTISSHIQNIFAQNELPQDESTVQFFGIVQDEGARSITRDIAFYNLDMIISVGYRVNSSKATHFRRWATKV